ncbi:PqqD family protein [Aeromicrobium ginsengisoli]|uniref:PqqD family protein n=1 Tax=Aeromicrobium ginsengisoli TaxID=363867 RepID=A0A5M4F9Z1_9ACTN|nr:PqqD family protein [Aeromicrobium ginsengisoli]KAA1395195.1 PqqD family protein [Aeromicrobium ginsengisoli]
MAPPRVSATTVLHASDSVLLRQAGTETVLLDLTSEEFFGLDGAGARMYELLAEPRTIDAVADVIVDEYDVDRDQLVADLVDLAAELVERGLVVADE